MEDWKLPFYLRYDSSVLRKRGGMLVRLLITPLGSSEEKGLEDHQKKEKQSKQMGKRERTREKRKKWEKRAKG